MDNAEKNSILIVDDEKMDLEILNRILSQNYTIYMTKNGTTAIEIANKYVPDLILLDIIMPEMNGYEVLAKLKESPKTQEIPVIFITGLDSVEDEEKGLGLDASDFIHKPFSSTIIKLRIRNQIQIVNQIKKIKNYAHEMAAAEERSKFFARMSHEMRTPLNAVIGLSEMTLEEGGLSEDARGNVEKINNSGSSLLALVNDILDISKIESGKFQIIPVEFETSVLISDAVTQNIMRKGEKPIEFILNIDEDLPAHLFGDDQRIRQVMNNLLSNAFKYTMEGIIELDVRCNLSDNDNVLFTASVKDSGIGIKNENISDLFSDYVQMDVKTNRTVEGTGLGLPITKMITEMMSGTISVESEYGKGSVFTVSIPLKLTNSDVIGPDVADKLKTLEYHAGKRNKKLISRITMPYAHVLIVDDTLINLDVAKGMMKPYKMKIDTLSGGIAAIDAVREEKIKYNAIFMDHMMPIMDGVEAVRIIREEIGTEYAKTVPIIALTANALSGNEEMFLSKGFQAFIPKPIEVSRLDAVINEWIRDEEQEKLYIDQQITVGGQTFIDSRTGKERRHGAKDRRKGIDRRIFNEKVKEIDFNKGLDRFRGDIDTYLQILKSFTANTKIDLNAMKEVDETGLAQYAIIAHGVKSSCRGICAEEMGNRAEALEKAAKAGDLPGVTAKNSSFIEDVLKMISNIEEVFSSKTVDTEKPKKEKPYSEALEKIKIACDNFQIEEIDKAMIEIECFEYTADDGLVHWLRENIAQMNFMEIVEKLSEPS
jgi:signal transduction histidine kinase/HPt (histidine-containing phosphotransfer) domain-containing protein